MDGELVYICEICQTVLQEHHCKAICPNCGRTMDCSDLPVIHANGAIEAEHMIWVPWPGESPPAETKSPFKPSVPIDPSTLP